ncbi:TRAP transporter large permease subunit [Chloroflexota bacterium]
MEWQLALLLLVGVLVVLMATGIPICVSFMLVNIIGALVFMRGEIGLAQLILSLETSLTKFTLLPLALFILMGEVMFHSGIAPRMIETLDKWLGRLPGRLGLIAVGAGTLFATLTGSSSGSVAMMGSVLTPEMEKRGYKKPMSLGPILGSGGLALMIPPSGLAILIGALGEISIAAILIAIIVPGLLMAALYASYIILRCQIQPSIAPAYEVTPPPLIDKLIATARYILPIGFIIFMVIGLILLGVAAPTEAAATGAIGTFILAAIYGRLNWQVVKKAVMGTVSIAVMIFMIILGAVAFGYNLGYSGVSRGVIEFAVGLPVAPILVFVAMLLVIVLMGMFMEVASIIMIATPLFTPVVLALGFDPVWFAVLLLLCIETGVTSPPFGTTLFVMKAVAPPNTTMGDVYRAALPFIGCDLIALVLIINFPTIALWLPGVIR